MRQGWTSDASSRGPQSIANDTAALGRHLRERVYPSRSHEDRAVSNNKTFMHTPAPIRQDTKAWKLQVWVSFGLAVMLCGTGLAYLPGEDLNRAFMVMGYMFCLSTAFALAKFVRDREAHQGGPSDTPLWSLVVWGGFALAMGLTGWGCGAGDQPDLQGLPRRVRCSSCRAFHAGQDAARRPRAAGDPPMKRLP